MTGRVTQAHVVQATEGRDFDNNAPKKPYHELADEAAELRCRVAKLERAVIEARRDPKEYRRGYFAGYNAGRRDSTPSGERRTSRSQRKASYV